MIYAKPTLVTIIPNVPPLKTGPLLEKLESCTKKIIRVQGGGDAAKTTTILQWLAIKAIQGRNLQITVVGVDVPNLKRGAIRVFKKYIENDPQIAPFIVKYNMTDREYLFSTGSVITFTSFENESNAIGAENDYVFINEANLQSYAVFWQLWRKCRKNIIIDYNPTFAFWAHAKLGDGNRPGTEKSFHGQVQMYIVDHRHNPFLTQEEHDNYENISDPERFTVYARGMTGKTTGAIFSFKRVNVLPKKTIVHEDGRIEEVPLDFGFGIDIGYTSDKTCIVKVFMNGKDHYYQCLLYKSNDEIQNEINEQNLIGDNGLAETVEGYMKKILVAHGCTMSSLVWGDHDKNMSNKLRRVSIPYRMARKGPNSEVAGISSVKRYNGYMYIPDDDPGPVVKISETEETGDPVIEYEQKSYVWQTAVDILTGNEITTGEPVEDVPDHSMAAIRYFEHSYAMRFAG